MRQRTDAPGFSGYLPRMEYASKAITEVATRKVVGPHQLARQLQVPAEDWRDGKAILGWSLFIVMVVVVLAARPIFLFS